jgi:hypothetical protein
MGGYIELDLGVMGCDWVELIEVAQDFEQWSLL